MKRGTRARMLHEMAHEGPALSDSSEVILADVLRPNPAMSAHVLALVLVVVATLNAGFAIMLWLKGAWPVAPFMGADVALLAWAFHAARVAAQREECLTLTRTSLHILRKPEASELSLNPYWVRVETAGDFGNQITLWSHGKGVRIGAFLAPHERVRAAQRLRNALGVAKNGRPLSQP